MKLFILKSKSRLVLLKPSQAGGPWFTPGHLPRTFSLSCLPQHCSECDHKPLRREAVARATLIPTYWGSFTLQRVNKYLRKRVRTEYGGGNTAGKDTDGTSAGLNRVLQMLTLLSSCYAPQQRKFDRRCCNLHMDIINCVLYQWDSLEEAVRPGTWPHTLSHRQYRLSWTGCCGCHTSTGNSSGATKYQPNYQHS